MRRRNFIGSLMGAVLPALALPAQTQTDSNPPKRIKPPRLKPGQTIGLIAPASNAWENDDIHWSIEIIESLGFKVKPSKNLMQRRGYLAGTDKERADDVNLMFRDEQVDAIFTLRGGYGSARILRMLDYEAIGKNPKILMGYSDISSLLNAIYRQTGLVTFHGPIAKQPFPEYTQTQMRRVLYDPSERASIGVPPKSGAPGRVPKDDRFVKIVGGKARGELVGGNLSVISRLIGTPFQPNFAGKLLFLEDVNEEPYRIDSLLTQLWLAGVFEQVTGVIFGKFTLAEPTNWSSLSIEEVLRDRFEPLKKPVIRGAMLGHVNDQAIFPIGIQAELNVDLETITLLEPAVS